MLSKTLKYFLLNFDQIGHAHNFDKEKNYLNLNTPYDLKSIMHYDSYAFSINPNSSNPSDRYTILSRFSPFIIGRNYNISDTDIKEIRMLYKCAPGNIYLLTVRII